MGILDWACDNLVLSIVALMLAGWLLVLFMCMIESRRVERWRHLEDRSEFYSMCKDIRIHNQNHSADQQGGRW